MMHLGISIERLPLPGSPPAPEATAGVVAFWGDSFAEGSSGGGAVSAYDSLQPTLRRYLLATGTGYRTVNHAVPGAGSDATVTAWLARAAHRAYNYVATGRNDATRPASYILANIDRILAARVPGEIVILGSVHNLNNGAESPGSDGHAKWTEVNAGLAARADGATVFFADHRAWAVYEHNTEWPEDVARAASDLPSASLVVSAEDALHLNARGCEMQARVILGCVLAHRALSAPLPNLLANPDFTGGATTGWTAAAGTVLTAADGVVAVSGGAAFKGLAQQALAAGAAGRKFFATWEVPAVATGGGAGLSVRLRESAGGGALHAVRDAPYARRTKGMFLAAEPNTAGLALQFEAINNAALTWSLAKPALREAYPQAIPSYAPEALVAPSLSGPPSVGAAVTGDPGSWDGYPEPTLSHRWLVDGAPVPGGLSFTPDAALEGRTLALEITAASAAGTVVRVTDPAVILPAQPLVNETFASLAGWSAGAGNAISLVGGRLRCANNGASWTKSFRTAAIPCVAGAQYRLRYDFLKTGHNGVLRIGWAQDGEDVRLPVSASGTGLTHAFTAGAAAMHLSVACDSAATSAYCDWDNIVIERI